MKRSEHLEKARDALIRAEADLGRVRVRDTNADGALGLAAQELEVSQQWAALTGLLRNEEGSA